MTQFQNIYTLRETDERTSQGQRESGRRLGERITDTTFWRNEVKTELEKLITEVKLLQDQTRTLDKSILDIEGPLHIAQECLYQRETRPGSIKATKTRAAKIFSFCRN